MPAGWEVSHEANQGGWHIVSDDVSEGTYSLRSDAITHGQLAAVAFSGTFLQGNVSFDLRVSSEIDYTSGGTDYLLFLIDGVNKGYWYGAINWKTLSFPISAGAHTLIWAYVKDASDHFYNTGASDATWIDGVQLPLPAPVDSTPPTGSITINNGAGSTDSTSVTLALSATDNSNTVSSMRFSNDGTNWSAWESYAVSKTWSLTNQEETKTVYVQFKDDSGNSSNSYKDTIIFDINTPPVADAGNERGTVIGQTISLDASNSRDPDGDTLTYQWEITTAPQNSMSTLTNSNTATPSFIPDLAGSYTFTLTTRDGVVNSTDTVTITVSLAGNTEFTLPTSDASSALTIKNIEGATLFKVRGDGVLDFPGITRSQRNAIVSPLSGMLIYQTDNNQGFYQFNGTVWSKLSFVLVDN
ncbi:PKD domain-containing protein [Deltaproteobacteria bacterium TL4]